MLGTTTTVCAANRSGNTRRKSGASRRCSSAKRRHSSAEPGAGRSAASLASVASTASISEHGSPATTLCTIILSPLVTHTGSAYVTRKAASVGDLAGPGPVTPDGPRQEERPRTNAGTAKAQSSRGSTRMNADTASCRHAERLGCHPEEVPRSGATEGSGLVGREAGFFPPRAQTLRGACPERSRRAQGDNPAPGQPAVARSAGATDSGRRPGRCVARDGLTSGLARYISWRGPLRDEPRAGHEAAGVGQRAPAALRKYPMDTLAGRRASRASLTGRPTGGAMTTEGGRVEELQVSGKRLLSTLKRVVREGNVRRVVVKNPGGRTVLDLPLTAGVVGAALLPFWAAVGGLAALAAHYTVVVERADPPRIAAPPDAGRA